MVGEQQPADLGTIGGRFQLLRRLANGGSGEVFMALDESSGRQVALKRLRQRAGANDKASTLSFMREFHALSSLRHPRIIEVYDYGVDRGAPYYTMELLEGHDLSEISPLPYREACSYLRDVASSLALLHARRLLHRDVSPRNVRRSKGGRCKLIDFGAMIPFGTPPNVLGTPPYVAPEVLQGGALDQTSDLYSLGGVAYYTLTGRHAFPARELSALPALWRRGIPQLQAADIPRALEELVMALLSPDPARRPASAAEVIERLSAIAELASEDDSALGRSALASTPLLGRRQERAQLEELLQETQQGRGGALLITGDPGVGRTRMLTEASLIAQTHGLAVVRLVLREQRGMSSSLMNDLLNGLIQALPEEAERATASSSSAPLQAAASTGDPAALLRMVEAFVCEIANQQPLLLTFDDVQYRSDQDAALIAALAHATSQRALTVIAAVRGARESSSFAHVSAFAAPLALRPFDRVQTAALCAALFGEVPNLDSVSESLFRSAQGNPKLTLELAERLLARGTLRYVAGSWVLPDAISEPMPQDIAQTLLLRLESVAADARTLAELLCVRRRGARMEQLLELAAPMPADGVFHALEELVGAGVLESARDEYAFIQDALRAELSRTLAQETSQALHLRWANYLLTHTAKEDDRLEAGWHLTHTANELRGAELLAEVAPALVEQRVSMATAIPAMERALQVFERHGRSLRKRLYLRALLVQSSYLYDYRLGDRYGDQTLDLLYPFTGLREVELCTRWFGKNTGFALGLTAATLRWLLRPAYKRGLNVIDALKYYAQSAIGLLGLRGLAVADTQAVLERMRAFEDSPHPSLALIYALAQAIHLHGLGRGADAQRSIQRAWTLLERSQSWQFTQHEYIDLKVGLLLLEGINEVWRERSRVFECADELERIGTPYAIACSLRIRMTYFLLRGEPAKAHYYRRLLELKAVESGSLWQVQWLAVPLEGLAGGTWHDLVTMRRSLERFDQILLEAPGLAPMRDEIQVAYNQRRGENQRAARMGEEFMRRFPPLTRIGWSQVYALTALAYLHLGQAQRAREICETAFASISPEDREYYVFYTSLEATYAMALSLTGEPERAAVVFRERLERLHAIGDYQRAIVMHHYRAELARLTGDSDALQQALVDMRATAAESQNPAALALAHRFSEARSTFPEQPLTREDVASESRDYETREATRSNTTQRALRLLCQRTNSAEGYVYLRNGADLQLTAASGNREPRPDFAAHLASLPVPANDAPRLALDAGYSAYAISGGFVVLRCEVSALPESLRSELEHSLGKHASHEEVTVSRVH